MPEAPAEAPAIESAAAVWTYADVGRAADALAERLSGLGGRGGGPPGERRAPRVGHAFDLSPEAIVAIHAVARAGAVLAPAHVGWTDAQVARYVAAVGPDAVLVSSGCPWPGSWDRVVIDLPGFGPVDLLTPGPEAEPELEPAPEPTRTEPPGTDVLLSTSGSGGAPRVVCHSWAGLRANARAANTRAGAGEDSVTLATLAWAHVGGLAIVVRAAESGGRIVCAQSRFDAAETVRAIERYGVTHLSVVPVMLDGMLDRMLDMGAPPPPGLRRVLTGGAATSRRLLDRAVEAGWPISLTYGLTEAGSQVATATPEDTADRGIGVLDRPLDGVEIDVGDDGDVSVRTPSMMLGYLEPVAASNAATASDTAPASSPRRDRAIAIDTEGWFATGDLAGRDEHGALRITGRRSNRIVTGGSNVDPEEVEDVLRDHPAVNDVCVIGIADERWGEIVLAVVALLEPSRASPPEPSPDPSLEASLEPSLEASLEEWSRRLLDAPRRPRRWRIVDQLPRTPTGKVDRQALRAAVEHTS